MSSLLLLLFAVVVAVPVDGREWKQATEKQNNKFWIYRDGGEREEQWIKHGINLPLKVSVVGFDVVIDCLAIDITSLQVI